MHWRPGLCTVQQAHKAQEGQWGRTFSGILEYALLLTSSMYHLVSWSCPGFKAGAFFFPVSERHIVPTPPPRLDPLRLAQQPQSPPARYARPPCVSHSNPNHHRHFMIYARECTFKRERARCAAVLPTPVP